MNETPTFIDPRMILNSDHSEMWTGQTTQWHAHKKKKNLTQNILNNTLFVTASTFTPFYSSDQTLLLYQPNLLKTSESTQICAIRVFFHLLFSCNFDDRLSSNFHRFVLLCMCWDAPSEQTGLDYYQRCPVPLSMINFSELQAVQSTLLAAFVNILYLL